MDDEYDGLPGSDGLDQVTDTMNLVELAEWIVATTNLAMDLRDGPINPDASVTMDEVSQTIMCAIGNRKIMDRAALKQLVETTLTKALQMLQ